MTQEETGLAPITGWDIRTVPAYGVIIFHLDFLTHATQTVEQAQKTPTFVLNPPQARELARRIIEGCDQLESGPPQGTGLPKH